MDGHPIYTILGGDGEILDLEYSPNPISSSASSCYLSPDTTVCLDPWLEIVEQPSEMFRFRYLTESQGTPHGPVMGTHATKSKKTYPTVKLNNFKGEAIIRCWLFTAADIPGPHVHKLVTKVGQKEIKEEPHDILVNEHNNYTASFENLVIIHSVRKECYDPFYEKKIRCSSRFPWSPQPVMKDKKILADIKQEIKKMNMNIVTLFFEALVQQDNTLQRICEVMSRPIKNKKNAEYGDLKIVRSDRDYGSCHGGDEVFIFVEKVTKEVKIKFFEEDMSGNIIWSDYATFSSLDIHHLVAIAFRTPPYKDLCINRNVTVKYQLERPNDTSVSNSMDFTYKPSEYRPPAKRPRIPDFIQQYPDSTNSYIPEEVRIEDNVSIDLLLSQLPSASGEFSFTDLDLSGTLVTDGPLEESKTDRISKMNIKISNCVTENKIVVEGRSLVQNTMKVVQSSIDKEEVRSTLLRTTYRNGCNSLHWAVLLRLETEFQAMLGVMQDLGLLDIIDVKNSLQRTALHLSVKMGLSNYIQSLVGLRANCNTFDSFGLAPVHSAIMEQPACLPVLLESSNIDLNLTTKEGLNTLHLATKCNSLESVKALLCHRIDLIESVNNKNGDTSLHIAADLSHYDLMLELLENDANLNAQNLAGNTPLHVCVANNDVKMAELLLKHEADPKICNYIETEEKNFLKWDPSGECLHHLDSNSRGQSIFHLVTSEKMFKLLNRYSDRRNIEADQIANGNGNLFNEEVMEKLCDLLDSGHTWAEVARKLGHSSLIPIMEKSLTPSKILLSYLDVSEDDSGSLQNIISVMEELKLTEAIQLLQNISN